MTERQLLDFLERLPQADSDPVRTDRVRARCHAALARNRRPRQVDAGSTTGWRLAAALSCAYIAEALRQALHLAGML